MSLIQAAKVGASWTAFARLMIAFMQFAQIAILARLLAPTDFGLMAIVTIVLGFFSTVSDIGISNAIIYRQDATELELSSLYWANIATSIPLFFLAVAISPLVGHLFSERRLIGLIPYAAIILLVSPIGSQFRVLLQRDLQFRVLTYLDVTAAVAGATVAIIFALLGFGVISLISGQIANTLISTSLVSFIGWQRWPPIHGFRYNALSRYLGFGFYQMAERFITRLSFQTDRILIGVLLGPHALGLYTVAWSLAVQPAANVNPVLTMVAFPIFSKIQDDVRRLRRGYLSLLRVLSTINAPLLVGLAAVSTILVPVVYGSRWLDIIPLVNVLSFVGLGMSLGNPVGSLLLSKGRADLGFKWNVALLFVQVPAIYIGAIWDGPLGIALALLAMQLLLSGPNYWFLVRAIVGPCGWDYTAAIAIPVFTALLMGGIIALLAVFFKARPSPMILVSLVAFGALVYVTLTLVTRPQSLSELRELVSG